MHISKSVKIGSNITLNDGGSWTSDFVRMPGLRPAGVIFLLKTFSGSGTTVSLAMHGKCDEWTEGQSPTPCVTRSGINSGGRYYVAVSPGVMVNSSTVGFPLPLLAANISVTAGTGVNVIADVFLFWDEEL